MVLGSSFTLVPSLEISSSAGSTRQAPIRKSCLSGDFIGDDLPEVLDQHGIWVQVGGGAHATSAVYPRNRRERPIPETRIRGSQGSSGEVSAHLPRILIPKSRRPHYLPGAPHLRASELFRRIARSLTHLFGDYYEHQSPCP